MIDAFNLLDRLFGDPKYCLKYNLTLNVNANDMVQKLLYALYYGLIQHLPHTRYFKAAGWIRKQYICRLMKVAKYHENSRFQNNVYLSGPGKVQIGQDCQINEHVFIQGAKIGDNVMIAPHTAILSNVKETKSLEIPMNKQGWSEKDKLVIIKDDVWIGRNAIIMPGVVIETGSVVAAGTVVTKSFPAYSVLGGVPAKVIKNRKHDD